MGANELFDNIWIVFTDIVGVLVISLSRNYSKESHLGSPYPDDNLVLFLYLRYLSKLEERLSNIIVVFTVV